MKNAIKTLLDIEDLKGPIERGLYDMPFGVYLELNNVSRSDLLNILKSPAHYIQAKSSPKYRSKAFEFGTAVHTFLEGVELFRDQYVKCPKVDRRTKAGKELLKEITEANPFKTVLDKETYERAENAATAVLLHPVASQYLNQSLKEITAIGPGNTEYGYNWKVRLDAYSQPRNAIIDFKTTQDASAQACMKSITNYKYYLQAAMYTDVFEQEAGIATYEYICIFVESEPPHGVNLIRMTEDAMALGSQEWRTAAQQYVQALTLNEWRGYCPSVKDYHPPQYLFTQVESTINEFENDMEMFI